MGTKYSFLTESIGMLTIRLARVGKTKQAQYRMVVADHRRAVTGRFIDVVGNVNPLTDPATVTLKKDEISEWLKKGAQPSATVRTILVREEMLKAPKGEQRPSKAPKRPDKYGKAEAAAPAAEATAEAGSEASESAEPAEASEEKTDTPEADVAEQPAETPDEVAEEPQAEAAADEASAEPAAAPGTPQEGDTES